VTRAAQCLALVSLALLGGCESQDGSNYAQMWKILRASVAAGFGDQKITRDQAAAIPYASMGWRVGGGNQMLVVLATDNGGQLMWTSAARIVLVTRDGRLMRSVGLAHDLGGTTAKGGGNLPAPATALAGAFSSSRLADYPDTGRYSVPINCTTRVAGPQAISILGRALATIRVDEACSSPSLRWRFTDRYWIDPKDGTVWRTLQHVHPGEDALETELLRPPG
jgi:hypothetical protein